METTPNEFWLYAGPADYVGLSVTPTFTADGGGYLLVMEISTGEVRVAATCNPSKYIAYWRNSTRRHGAPELTRVLVSRPHLRYEAAGRVVARQIQEIMAERHVTGIPIDEVIQKAQQALTSVQFCLGGGGMQQSLEI